MSLAHQLFLQSIRETEQLAPDRLDRYREPLVASLITHIWSSVPFYRERLAPLIRENEFDIAYWPEVPLLRPEDIRAHLAAMTAQRLPDPYQEVEEAVENEAVPLLTRSRLSRVAADCELERIYEVHGLNLSAKLAILEPERVGTEATGRGWSVTFERNTWVAGDPTASSNEHLEWLARTGARQLRTKADLAAGLADIVLSSHSHLRLEAILISDELTPPVSAKLKAAFGARVTQLLALPVVGVVAASAEDGFRVPSASVLVEVVDPVGRPVEPGGLGEIVVTPLYEFATPLLRLATGFGAEASLEPNQAIGIRRLLRLTGRVRG